MSDAARRNRVAGWICLIGLMVGFGLFTQWMLDRPLPGDTAPRPPSREPIVWTSGPGLSSVTLRDGSNYHLVGRRCVVTLRLSEGGEKTLECWLIEATDEFIRIRLIQHKHEIKIARKDVISIHLFDQPR